MKARRRKGFKDWNEGDKDWNCYGAVEGGSPQLICRSGGGKQRREIVWGRGVVQAK